jgi:hypothetical protein
MDQVESERECERWREEEIEMEEISVGEQGHSQG